MKREQMISSTILFVLILSGCQPLDRLIHGRKTLNCSCQENQFDMEESIMGLGQSNANNPIIWATIANKINQLGGNAKHGYFAVSNTSSWYWAANTGGVLDQMESVIKELKPTRIIWMQGEGDQNTNPGDYSDNLKIIFSKIRSIVPNAKIYIALESYNNNYPTDGLEITRLGQLLAIDKGVGIRGIDIDKFRTDECSGSEHLHFYDSCKEKIGVAWFEYLEKNN